MKKISGKEKGHKPTSALLAHVGSCAIQINKVAETFHTLTYIYIRNVDIARQLLIDSGKRARFT